MSNKWKNVRKIRIVFSNCCHFENMHIILIILVRARITSPFIISVSSKPNMHGDKGVNAAETELLNRFGRVQAPDCKEKHRRKSRVTLLRSETPNKLGIEWRTKWKP